jgi:hypothetical protein
MVGNYYCCSTFNVQLLPALTHQCHISLATDDPSLKLYKMYEKWPYALCVDSNISSKFADGFAFSKGKMEEILHSGVFDKPKSTKESFTAKKEDVDLIVPFITTSCLPSFVIMNVCISGA